MTRSCPDPLLHALRSPPELTHFGAGEWDLLLRQADSLKLLAHLELLIERHGLRDGCPPRALAIVSRYRYYLGHLHTAARQQIVELHELLSPHDIPVMLLKGAAYLHSGFDFARSRHLSDIDVMIPEHRLARAERILRDNGWTTKAMTAYDERYYRTWMHELPPLTRERRPLELDLHHRILPRSSRLSPAPQALWDQSRALNTQSLRRLCPEDLFLHSAAHLFYDSDFAGRLRDLVDLQELAGLFAARPEFWARLPERARLLQLNLPLWHALAALQSLLHTPIPPDTLRQLRRDIRPGPAQWLAGRLARRVLRPTHPDRPGHGFSAWLLYLRSHWLRMPPGLLARHLLRKGLRRIGN